MKAENGEGGFSPGKTTQPVVVVLAPLVATWGCRAAASGGREEHHNGSGENFMAVQYQKLTSGFNPPEKYMLVTLDNFPKV